MKKKSEMEYRFYQIPAEEPCLALFGEKWFQVYGSGMKDLHFHNYMEIGICYGGYGKMRFGEEVYDYNVGKFTLIPKNYPHTTNSDTDVICSWEYLFVDAERILKRIYGENHTLYARVCKRMNTKAHLINVHDQPEMAKSIQAILKLMRERGEFYQEKVEGLVQALVFEIACLNRREYEELIDNDGKKRLSWIDKTVDYISDYYMEPIKVPDLADRCHISEAHFRRLFAKHMKMSPVEYINLVRINIACDYMRKTNDTISDISVRCGYANASTFHRNFKKITGMSAREWQKNPEVWERQLLKYNIQTKEGW